MKPRSRSGAPLRLSAEDAADLEILSAALQDSIFRAEDAAFDPRGRRFALRVNRYRWEAQQRGAGERVQSLFLLDNALAVRSHRLRRDDPEAVANLLALRFEPDGEPPGGVVRLLLSGGGEIEARVEALEASLSDLTEPWDAVRRPDHGSR